MKKIAKEIWRFFSFIFLRKKKSASQQIFFYA